MLELFKKLPVEEESIKTLCRGYLSLQVRETLEEFEPSFVLLYGGTGVGKSSLMNTLFQGDYAKVSALRPATRNPVFLVHQSFEAELKSRLKSVELPFSYEIVSSDDELMRKCVFVDSPDYDSLELKNQETADALFRFCDLVLVVTSPAKYGDELTQLAFGRARQYDKTLIGVLNKSDTLTESDLAQVLESFSTLYKEEVLSSSSTSPENVGSLKDAVKNRLGEIKRDQQVQRQRHELAREIQFQLARANDSLQVQESLYAEISRNLEEVESKFWQRHQQVQVEMEKGLRSKLAKIAEEKVFYLSKFVLKSVLSIVPGMNDEKEESGTSAWAQTEYDRKIRENLEMAMRETHWKLQEELVQNRNLEFRGDFDLEAAIQNFESEFATFRDETYGRITQTFQSRASSKHSVMAVSQEVLLSLVFYSLLGPIGLLPGWEQVLSGLCYLVYGKLPANVLPSVMLELEDLSKECKDNFKEFLSRYLSKPSAEFLQAKESLNHKRQEFESVRSQLEKSELFAGVRQ